jgi:tRNA-splicing ligase RtcB
MNHDYDNFDNDDDESPPRPRKQRKASHSDDHAASLKADPRISLWLADPLAEESYKALCRLQSLASLSRMAVMPDVHPAGDVAVGCVLGIDQMVYPQAIGGDIGCGMSAVRLRGLSSGKGLRHDLEAILTGFNRSVNIMTNRGRELEPPARLSLPDASDLAAVALRAFGGNEAMRQLGTLGRGNHFVELQSDSS